MTKDEAIAAGRTHLRLRCPCKIKEVPWDLLPSYPGDVPLHTFTLRMKCQRCGQRPQVVAAVDPREAASTPIT